MSGRQAVTTVRWIITLSAPLFTIHPVLFTDLSIPLFSASLKNVLPMAHLQQRGAVHDLPV